MDSIYTCKIIFMSLTGFFLTMLILPILLPIGVLFGIVFISIFLIVKIKYGGRAYMASGTDIVHGKHSAHSQPVINIICRLQGKLDIQKIRQHTHDIIFNTYNKDGRRRYARLMEVYTKAFGYTIWKKVGNFKIENHVKEIKLTELCKKAKEDISKGGIFQISLNSGELNWKPYVSYLLHENGMNPFPDNLPMWEILALDENEKSHTIHFRFHHAVSDGIYLLRMFYEDMVEQPYFLFKNYNPPSHLSRLLLNLWTCILVPFGLWKILSKNDRNPLHGPPLVGKKRFFISDRISMESLNSIKRNEFLPKTSIHAIALSCVSHSVSKHFARRGCEVAKITALMPFPLQNKKHEIKLKNKFAVASLDFPVTLTKGNLLNSGIQNTHYPALERLKQIQESLLKSGQDISMWSVNSLINNLCYYLPTTLAEALLSVKGCTLCVSHLPGGKSTATVFERQVLDHMFWVPDREPMGVGFSVYSYNGYLRAGLIIDQALIQSDEEGDFMMENFVKEVDNLLLESETHKMNIEGGNKNRNSVPSLKQIP